MVVICDMNDYRRVMKDFKVRGQLVGEGWTGVQWIN